MNALIIGGARSGAGCAKLLHQHGYQVTLCANQDFPSRQELEALGIRVVLDDLDLSLVRTYDVVVKNPGIPNDHPLVAKFKHVLNEIEVASWFSQKYRYYAVSGTNGKTTTTTMLYEMLKRKDRHALLAGNVGYALSEAVYHDGDIERDVALEISAFQMEGTPSFVPDAYALLNLTPDHLDRYEDETAYYQAKTVLLERVPLFVRNADDSNVMDYTRDHQGETLDVSLDKHADVFSEGGWIHYHDAALFKMDDLKIVGRHNIFNAAVAAVLAYRAGVSLEDIQHVIQTFAGVEHRIEFVREHRGIRFYNDSKATNPESTEVCLQSFAGNVILLAGGYDKHISFKRLIPYTDRLKAVFLFGESAVQMKTEVFTDAHRVATMEDALKQALGVAEPGDVIVLSPACASYDQFTDFEDRGQQFKEFVKTLE